MDIRRFESADAEDVARIRAATITQLTEFYDRAALEAWAGSIGAEDFKRTANEYHRFVAMEDGKILGYGDWKPGSNEFAGIYIDPEAQGKGVGSALFDAIEADARAAGAPRLWANATKNARTFYEKHGFSEEGEGYYQAGDYHIRTLMMGKRLA
jgi:putative acetyltransferase